MESNIGFKTIINGKGYHQFGKKVLITQVGFSTIEAILEVDRESCGKVEPQQRAEMREFILQALKGKDLYFPPFIFSARGALKHGSQGWSLDQGSKLYILDGKYRASAMSSALSHLHSQLEKAEESGKNKKALKIQGYIEKLKTYPVAMQIYLNLTPREERNFISDIHLQQRSACTGWVIQFDRRDGYAELTRILAGKLENEFEIEQELSRLTDQNSAVTSLAVMRKCLAALFEGNLSVKQRAANIQECQMNEFITISLEFFETWNQLFPKLMANRRRYVTGLSGIQIALANTIYSLTKKYSITHLEAIRLLKPLKQLCTWKHNDPLFIHLYDSAAKRIKYHSTITAIQQTTMNFLKIIEKERKGGHS